MRCSIAVFVGLVVLAGTGQVGAESVVINEFMASNNTTLADEDGDYHDWIELYNPTGSAVDLQGWFLSDNSMNLTKWMFPAVELKSDEYLLVFASGKDRTNPIAPLHTSFRLNSAGEYLGLVQPDGMTIANDFAPAYPQQVPDVPYSFGLLPNGGGSPKVFLEPSPREPNVPEPSTAALLGIGVVGLLSYAWRRRRLSPCCGMAS